MESYNIWVWLISLSIMLYFMFSCIDFREKGQAEGRAGRGERGRCSFVAPLIYAFIG